MGLGNRAGVIILYLAFYMPMNVLLYSGYLKNIPMALEEAADIDGASTWTTYWRVVSVSYTHLASLDTDKYDISMTIMDAAGSQRAQDDQVQEMICLLYTSLVWV